MTATAISQPAVTSWLEPAVMVAAAALFVSVVTLVYVVVQTRLNRNMLETTNKALALTLKTVQVDMLANAGWATSVMAHLDLWLEDLERTLSELRKAQATRDPESLRLIAGHALKTPAGLVQKFEYEHAPAWLSTILMAAAQYYYDARAAQAGLWRTSEDAPWFEYVPSLVEVFERSAWGVRELRTMIDDALPDAYLESPARLSDERFF